MQTLPDNQPFAGYAADLERRQERDAALKLAWATPLPGPLRDAFCCTATIAPGGALRPVTLGDLILLTRLRSPLIGALTAKMAGESCAGHADPVRLDDYDVSEASLLWTLPHSRACQLLDHSPAGFRKQAMARLARLSSSERGVLAETLLGHLFGAFRTSVALQAAAGDSAETVIHYGEATDGFGWWLYLLGTMMRDFGMSREYALGELPLAQALALQAWSQYSAGRGLELETEGYIAQEAQRRASEKG